MIQNVMIEIESDKMLSEYGDRHIILFDKNKKRYYVQTRENFLSEQNQENNKIRKEIKDLKKEIKNIEDSVKKYIDIADKKYQDFLLSYQETNQKVLNLVKSVVVEA